MYSRINVLLKSFIIKILYYQNLLKSYTIMIKDLACFTTQKERFTEDLSPELPANKYMLKVNHKSEQSVTSLQS